MENRAGSPAETGVRPWLGARAAFVSARIRSVYAYRADVLVWLIGPALQIGLMAALWRAVYAGRDAVDGVTLPVMTTYVSLAVVHQILARDDTVEWIERRVRDGKIGTDLARPVSLLQQQMCGLVAQFCVKLPMVALMLPVAALLSGVAAPAAGAAGPYVVSVLSGLAVNAALSLLVGAVAFWTLETGGMTLLYFVATGFLSGALVPLWFMPEWLASVLDVLPWAAVVYTPLSVYLGQVAGPEMWREIGVQVLWAAVLWGVVALVWRRVVHRVVVQGG